MTRLILLYNLPEIHVQKYLVESETIPGQLEIMQIWRGTAMSTDADRKQALAAFRLTFADVLDWNTAQYNNGKVLMYT